MGYSDNTFSNTASAFAPSAPPATAFPPAAHGPVHSDYPLSDQPPPADLFPSTHHFASSADQFPPPLHHASSIPVQPSVPPVYPIIRNPLFKHKSYIYPDRNTPPVPTQHIPMITSGPLGQSGAAGYSGPYAQPGSFGHSGVSGGNALPIQTTLQSGDDPGTAFADVGAGHDVPIRYTISISNASASVYHEAAGGHGGHGGPGGDGGPGVAGRNGSDATRYSGGTSGGPGGDGGDGGMGGSGGHGGSGGAVSVVVNEHDMHLLLLFKTRPATVGGRGGQGGAGGRGGQGGPGGAGGRSLRVNDTNGHSTTIPGGANGPPGREGVSGTGGLQGRAGVQGAVSFVVNGVGNFPWRYDLRVGNVDTVGDEYNYNVVEPGGRGFVILGMENCGDMSMPTHQRSYVTLEANSAIAPFVQGDAFAQSVIELPTLRAKDSANLNHRLGFTVVDVGDPFVGRPYFKEETIGYLAYLSGINQRFPLVSEQATKILVSFPLVMTKISGEVCAVEDGEAFVMWTVTNISSQAVGIDALRSRAVQSRLTGLCLSAKDDADSRGDTLTVVMDKMGHVSGSPILPPSSFKIGTVAGGLAAESTVESEIGLIHPMPLVAPGQRISFLDTVRFQSRNSIPEGGALEPHSQAYVTSYLELEHPQYPTEVRPIQVRPFQLQLSEQFSYREGVSKCLLVTNNRTTPKEVEDWRALISGLFSEPPNPSQVSIWNMSLYRGFSLKYKLPQQGQFQPTIGHLFRRHDNTVIFLNNSSSPDGVRKSSSETLPLQHLQYQELLHAQKDHGHNMYIVGSKEGAHIRERVRIALDAHEKVEFATRDTLVSGVQEVLYPQGRAESSSDIGGQASTVLETSISTAYMDSDLKGVLRFGPNKKLTMHNSMRRTFTLRKNEGILAYYNKTNSPRPQEEFHLSSCTIKSSPSTGTDISPQGVLTIQAGRRVFHLGSVSKKGVDVGPSISKWEAEISSAIGIAREEQRSSQGRPRSTSDSQSDFQAAAQSNPDFHTSRPPGFEKYCAMKVIRTLAVSEATVKNEAEKLAKDLAVQYPELELTVVYKYFHKGEQERNTGVSYISKRNIGEISVYRGRKNGFGSVISDISKSDPSKQESNTFVHRDCLSARNKFGLLKSLSIMHKIDLLKNSLLHGWLAKATKSEANITISLLVDVLLSDAADEQARFRLRSEAPLLGALVSKISIRGKRAEMEELPSKMKVLSSITAPSTLGSVQLGSTKYVDIFRLCVYLRVLVRSIGKIKGAPSGTVVQVSLAMLEKFENHFAAAVGMLKGRKQLKDKEKTIDQTVNGIMKNGLLAGEQRITPERLLCYWRSQWDLGGAKVVNDDGLYVPTVISHAEFAELQSYAKASYFPKIRRNPGRYSSEAERQAVAQELFRSYQPEEDDLSPQSEQ